MFARLRFRQFIFRLTLCCLLLLVFSKITAQERIGFYMPEHLRYVEVKFEKYSNLIVIPITVNNMMTLKFVLDTGAESAILTEKLFGDLLGMNYVREINIQAPGIIDSLRAYVATGVSMSIEGGIRAEGVNMLVLEENYLELDKNLGDEIYGVIGYDIFNRFVVSIDYDESVIRFFNKDKFKGKNQGLAVDMKVIGSKPYVNMIVKQNAHTDSVKLMVDTGASHAVLLDVYNTDDMTLPEKVVPTLLGQGLGGEIPGYIGRLDQCILSRFSFDDVLVSIPQEGAYVKAIKRGSRHGTIGGDLLTRFEVTFDYGNEKMYLRQGRLYRDPFEANMSGMTIGAHGDNLDSLVVTKVQKNTPAYRAGIKAGDYILKVNSMTRYNSSLSEINALLRRKSGLKVSVSFLRNGNKKKSEFKLKRLI